MSADIKKLERIATELRIKVIQMMEKATSGHAGGSPQSPGSGHVAPMGGRSATVCTHGRYP